MLVYRLVRRPYASQLDGYGAALFGGRWNSVGLPVIYTAQHRSLAVLEYRVNNPNPVSDLMMGSLGVPNVSVGISIVTNLPPTPMVLSLSFSAVPDPAPRSQYLQSVLLSLLRSVRQSPQYLYDSFHRE